jgi:hypothetical protein
VCLTQDLGSGTQTEHNNTITSDVVNPGPGSGTQPEHYNTMTSDVLNPGPESGTETEHNNTMTSDVVKSLVMVLVCSACVPVPGP